MTFLVTICCKQIGKFLLGSVYYISKCHFTMQSVVDHLRIYTYILQKETACTNHPLGCLTEQILLQLRLVSVYSYILVLNNGVYFVNGCSLFTGVRTTVCTLPVHLIVLTAIAL